MKAKTQEINTDGVQYRKVSNARLILAMSHAASIGCFTSAIGYVSYAANLGFGIPILLVGTLMTISRIFDGITDPLVSLLVDRVNTKFGKLRIFMSMGWLLESVSIMALYQWACGKGHSVLLFMVLYLLYYIGYTMQNMAGQMISPVITNDPKQRPMVGVWNTIYTYIIAIVTSMAVAVVLLPRFGNEYTLELMGIVAKLMVAISFLFLVLCMIGISPIDRPENFVKSESQHVSPKTMLNLIAHNSALQRFVIAATSDKLAMQISNQAIISTVLYGIIVGNMAFSAFLNMVAIIPSFIFAFVSAKYTGKHGSRDSITFWTRISIYVNLMFVLLMFFSAHTAIAAHPVAMVAFVVLTLLANGLRVAVSTGTSSMLADVVDYEAARSGNYMPGTVSGVYGFIDKLVSSLGALIATACVAMIGYTTTAPQPTDSKTMPIVIMGTFLVYVVPIIGWVLTLIALKNTPITKEEMVEVQKKIADLKREEE